MMQEEQTINRQLRAARYVAHKLFVHKYASAVAGGHMSPDEAKAHYDEAMRNYDGIMSNALSGHSEAANAAEVAKGADAITGLLETTK